MELHLVLVVHGSRHGDVGEVSYFLNRLVHEIILGGRVKFHEFPVIQFSIN